MKARPRSCLLGLVVGTLMFAKGAEASPSVEISTPMPAPMWARLERQILVESVPACREFAQKYYDDRGYVQCFVRWGANDGADDAFENFSDWPQLHALGASDEILGVFLKTWNGMIRQYSEAKTVEVPAGRDGIYFKEFNAQADWMHLGEGLRTFNQLALSAPDLPSYHDRVRRWAGLYMAEDPAAPNYDPEFKLIRSMQNGSKGPMLRQATALDWVGDPFDVAKFVAGHGESTFAQFLEHYREYSEVVGDHFLNLVATTLPTNAYLLTHESKYKQWLVGYMEAWLARMKANGGVIPSYVALDGKVGGRDNRWWGNAYGWGFSPSNPVTGMRENRNRIPRATVGFANALLVTGDQKYAGAWRDMIVAVNSHARMNAAGRKEYPTMCGPEGWYGWQPEPWNVGALELWYWSQRPDDRARVSRNPWLEFLEGRNPEFPEMALRRDLEGIAKKTAGIRADTKPADRRLADNMMEFNPASVVALEQLMWGAIPPGREGSLLSARLRYFDPVAKRAGVPPDVGALVSELTDTRTVVTLVNLSPTDLRTVVVQGGAYGEHQILSVALNGKVQPINARDFTVRLSPGAGARLGLVTKRYANSPTVRFPWDRN